jgi:hypothetical protein
MVTTIKPLKSTAKNGAAQLGRPETLGMDKWPPLGVVGNHALGPHYHRYPFPFAKPDSPCVLCGQHIKSGVHVTALQAKLSRRLRRGCEGDMEATAPKIYGIGNRDHGINNSNAAVPAREELPAQAKTHHNRERCGLVEVGAA